MVTPYPFSANNAVPAPTEYSAAQADGSLAGQSDDPPTGNTGGKFQAGTEELSGEPIYVELVGPRGEWAELTRPAGSGHNFSAFTDYLNFTFRFEPGVESLSSLFQELFALLGDRFAPAVDRNKKFHFYGSSYDLGTSTAILGIGGQRGTVLVSLPGSACALINDWQRIVDYGSFRKARITRWDGAVDDFIGNHSVDFAVQLYRQGLFNAGGNQPVINQRGNWINPDGRGRTLNVGMRENGKMLRVYEKGMQLGKKWDPWARWEAELHNTRRIIPWEVLLKPGPYLVGSYPKALGWIQDEALRIKTIQKQTKISYREAIAHARRTVGRLINVMVNTEESPEAVIKKLRRDGSPKRLLGAEPVADEGLDE